MGGGQPRATGAHWDQEAEGGSRVAIPLQEAITSSPLGGSLHRWSSVMDRTGHVPWRSTLGRRVAMIAFPPSPATR
ncbi:hypothetical protein NL676_032167 [Syzygium grande]|nr:hypothetical protein NL676_032167 [Syzygium grande]